MRAGTVLLPAGRAVTPGVVGVLYWPRANQYGFLAGLAGGVLVWLVTLRWNMVLTRVS